MKEIENSRTLGLKRTLGVVTLAVGITAAVFGKPIYEVAKASLMNYFANRDFQEYVAEVQDYCSINDQSPLLKKNQLNEVLSIQEQMGNRLRAAEEAVQ